MGIKITKELFYEKFDLKLMSIVKSGNEILGETEFAMIKGGKDKFWEIINNSLDKKQIKALYDSVESADIETDSPFTWRINKFEDSQTTNKEKQNG